MRKRKTKLLAMLLVFCMALALVPNVSARATENYGTETGEAVTDAKEEQAETTEQTEVKESKKESNQTAEVEKKEPENVVKEKEAATKVEESKTVEEKNETDVAVQKTEKTETAGKTEEKTDNAGVATQGVSEIIGGGNTQVETTVRDNYTDDYVRKTIYFKDGQAQVEGDYSAIKKIKLNQLGELQVNASYDADADITSLLIDVSGINKGATETQYISEDYEEVSVESVYKGSKLTYTGTTYDENKKATIHEIRDDYYLRTHKLVKYVFTISGTDTNTKITKVDVGNIWKNLSVGNPIPFTGEVNPNSECANQMEIVKEGWYSEGHRIESTDETSGSPIENLRYYTYYVTLQAKAGYEFSDTFNNQSRDNTVQFICDGKTITAYHASVSNNGKTITFAEFMTVDVMAGTTDDKKGTPIEPEITTPGQGSDTLKPDAATPTKDSVDANSNAKSKINNAKNSEKTASPKTGDGNNLALWLIVLFEACGAIIGGIAYKRKNKLS